MSECDALRVKAERGVAHGEGLGFSNHAASQIRSVADDGETKMPKMNADLIGATSQGPCKEQGGAVGIACKHAELRVGR